MNFIPFNFRGQGTINWLNVGHLEFKMADTKTIKTAYPAYNYCIIHISETNKGRDLIFGRVTPLNLEYKIFQSAHQPVPLAQVAPPTYQNLTLTTSQILLKLET